MKISRLIDDFEDDGLRRYWDKNFQYLSNAPEIKESIGTSTICFSPAYKLILKNNDHYKSKEDHSLTNSVNFINQSNTEIYEAMNYKLCYDLSNVIDHR